MRNACVFEMEAGKPKSALPEDVAKLEARAEVNPALRPPSRPPSKATSPAGTPMVKMLRVPEGKCDIPAYYDGEELEVSPDEPFYGCQEPPESKHPISDTGDIAPPVKSWPCHHMWRTKQTMCVPQMQSNNFANWVRCPFCGHTHATITYSATCCRSCKERFNTMVTQFKGQRHRQGLTQSTQPPIDAVDVTRNCPWTRWGIMLSQFLFKMTPANAIAQAQKELNAKRSGDPNGPWGEYNPRPEPAPIASAVVHLQRLLPSTVGGEGAQALSFNVSEAL